MSRQAGRRPLVTSLSLLAAATLTALLAFALQPDAGAEDKTPSPQPAFRIDFYNMPLNDAASIPKGWKFQGKWGAPAPSFQVIKDPEAGRNILKLDPKKGSGTIIFNLTGKIDLKKTPIVRWRWKAVKLPAGADGRPGGKDDQVIGLYFGCGNLTRKSVAYRWETLTPVGATGESSYGAGLVSAKWHCIRNQSDPLNKWIVEERNLAEDFKRDFGEIPQDTAISIASNSQYTNTEGEAYLDYVEFLPAAPPSAAK